MLLQVGEQLATDELDYLDNALRRILITADHTESLYTLALILLHEAGHLQDKATYYTTTQKELPIYGWHLSQSPPRFWD
ncbi:MAG: hypothetical protein GY711_09020 [bacterium]|nr:hypothetical protein [bacterium]